jgi:hypothetical protein
MSRPPNRDSLPPIREIAETLRNGWDFDDLCERHDISASTLANRLSYAGYATSGHALRKTGPRQPLTTGGSGSYVTGHAGGGDYLGLPIEPVLHRRLVRRVFTGLDWSTSPASGPMWRYA